MKHISMDILTRKCAKCKGEIEIQRDNISNVLQYQGKYYHSKCFEITAAQKAASKRGNHEQWKEALDNIWELEADTKKSLERFWAKDDLNVWLLDNYDISVVPTRFWQVVADLEAGKYKGKRCKPVGIEMLLGMWKWGQRKLNEINQYNKSHNKGPTDDNARLMYDLAILVGKLPQFLAYKEKKKENKMDMARSTDSDDIDMSRIGQGKQSQRRDISDISDDIFVE